MTIIDYLAKKQAKAHTHQAQVQAQDRAWRADLIIELEEMWKLAQDISSFGARDLIIEAIQQLRDEGRLREKYDAAMAEKREREVAS